MQRRTAVLDLASNAELGPSTGVFPMFPVPAGRMLLQWPSMIKKGIRFESLSVNSYYSSQTGNIGNKRCVSTDISWCCIVPS